MHTDQYPEDTARVQDAYNGPEKRLIVKRRSVVDKRKRIRFDAIGGDRRSGVARRKTDQGFRDLNLTS